LPGLHITDHQMRLCMSCRQTHGAAVAAAKAGFSTATATGSRMIRACHRRATIDRLVHHATILEMNVESYRRKAALKRKRGPAD
jgi:hypothetical protein